MKWMSLVWGRDFLRCIDREELKVHSVFRTVVNLQSNPNHPLISLTTRPEAMGPNVCLVKGPVFSGNLTQGAAISVQNRVITSGSTVIDCSKVADWEPLEWSYRPAYEPYRLARDWLERQAPGLAETRNKLTEQLTVSLQTGNEVLLLSTLEGILGHGEGLTPSGDDFVAGVLLAFVKGFCLTHESNEFVSRLPLIIKDIWWRTNSISQTMLWYATQGEGAAYVVDAASAIYAGCSQTLGMASRLWQIGATSGRYLLSGVLLGCEIFWTREQKEHGREDFC